MKFLPDTSCMRICGRHTFSDGILYLGYSASFAEFETEAEKITVSFVTDEIPEEKIYLARVCVWVDMNRKAPDENGVREAVFAADTLLTEKKQTADAYLGRPGETKTVRIVKLSEAAFGLAGIAAVETEGNYGIRPTSPKKRLIGFIGDSITCGYGNEGHDGIDTFSTSTENPLDAYAVLTAEVLHADYRLVSWSGIGVISDYVPPEENRPRREILMQRLYPYNDVRLEEKLRGEYVFGEPFVISDDKTPYSFADQPDAIVILLGTNDHSYTRGIPERNEDFAWEYEGFLDKVHKLNPKAPILCTCGIQGTLLVETEEKTVRRYAARHPEVPIRFLPLEEQPAEGKGADGHPNKKTHVLLAEKVTSALKKLLR